MYLSNHLPTIHMDQCFTIYDKISPKWSHVLIVKNKENNKTAM